ncbi:hypothetical protein Ancab_037076 [Ancistrocladus abbreviatus]
MGAGIELLWSKGRHGSTSRTSQSRPFSLLTVNGQSYWHDVQGLTLLHTPYPQLRSYIGQVPELDGYKRTAKPVKVAESGFTTHAILSS